jgi:hypothetical protein
MSTRIQVFLKIFHTDLKDLKDGYAVRYAGRGRPLGVPLRVCVAAKRRNNL